MCRLGPIILSKGIGFLIFILVDLHLFLHYLSNFTYFSRFTPIFTHIIPLFILCTPILAVVMLRAFLLNPIFAIFIFRAACGTPVMLLSLTCCGVGTQLPPKIGSLAKSFLLASSLTGVSSCRATLFQCLQRNHLTL